MIALESAPAEVRFTLTVTRAETGLTETFDMVGHVAPATPETNDVPLALDAGA